MDRTRLNRCLNPASIAVVGGAEAARVIEQCHKLGFNGDLWAVHPQRDSMHGLRCYRTVQALPQPPDATFIAIPADSSLEVVQALARRGAGGAVCYASGFKETGAPGKQRQQRLLEAAGAMPIIGPNCYGFINLLCGAALWPDYHGATRTERGVAIFSQSGNVSLNLSMQRRLLPVAWLVTLGNQASVGFEEAIAAALDNDRITAIGLHLEGLNDLPRFVQLAERARQQGIPMVALKVGRSAHGARITLSHTATLAGEGALYDALFERLGVGQTSTPEELIETLKLLSVSGVLPGKRLASLSCSGGEATLVADLGERQQLEFPALTPSHRQAVQATLNDYVQVDNPLDYHTFIWGDEERMRATFGAMLDGNFDLTLLLLDMPHADAVAMEVWQRAVHAFIAACRCSGKKGAVVASLSEGLPQEVGQGLLENGIAPLHGLAQALTAVAVAGDIGAAWARAAAATDTKLLLPRVARLPNLDLEWSARHASPRLDEQQAKNLLASVGFAVPQAIAVTSPAAAVAAAEQLGYPVAVKVLSNQIAHKTEVGAVAINLQSKQQVRAQATRMLHGAERLMVEKMIEHAVAEMLLGIGYDRQFGHYLMLGFGGALVELIGDRQLLLPPVNQWMVRAAIKRLQTAPLLHGYRRRPPADVEAVVDSVLRLNRLLDEQANALLEVEINPLMVKSEKQGAVVADALITMRTP